MVWYAPGASYVKPKFKSPSKAKGQYLRAAMRLNTDEGQALVKVTGKFNVDYSNK